MGFSLVAIALAAGCDAGGEQSIPASEDVQALGVARYKVLTEDSPVQAALLGEASEEVGRLEFTDPTTGERSLAITWDGVSYRWDAKTAAPPEEGPEQEASHVANLAARELAEALGMWNGPTPSGELGGTEDRPYLYWSAYGYSYSTGGFGSPCDAATTNAFVNFVYSCYQATGHPHPDYPPLFTMPGYNDCTVVVAGMCSGY